MEDKQVKVVKCLEYGHKASITTDNPKYCTLIKRALKDLVFSIDLRTSNKL